MLVKTFCAAVTGLEATTITIEVNISRGVMFHLSGMADTAVRESYDRIQVALPHVGFKVPVSNITVNLSPADIRKEGSSYDLPMAIGILAANGNLKTDNLKGYMMVGELGLDGKLKPIRAALPISILARKEHFKGLIVPRENAREAAVVNNLEVYGMNDLKEVIDFLNDPTTATPEFVDTRKEFYEQQYSFDLDYADVRGQAPKKRWTRQGRDNVSYISRQQKTADPKAGCFYFCLYASPKYCAMTSASSCASFFRLSSLSIHFALLGFV